MSRRHRAVKREVIPDPKFKDVVVSKFMSCLMFDGKRSLAESIVTVLLNKSRVNQEMSP